MKTIIICFLLIFSAKIYAQDTSKISSLKRKSVYFEGYGQGIFSSFNFDKLYRVDKKVKSSFTTGVTIRPFGGLFVLGVPISYNFLFGKNSHHLELGLGITALGVREIDLIAQKQVYYSDSNFYIQDFMAKRNSLFFYCTPKVGYRFQNPNGGLFFRVAITPPMFGFAFFGNTKTAQFTEYNKYTETFGYLNFYGKNILHYGGISLGWTFRDKKGIEIPEGEE